VSTKLCLVVAFLAGAAFAAAILFGASVRQWPLLVRYTTLHEDELKKDLEELKDALDS
jgi:hypothetical protein